MNELPISGHSSAVRLRLRVNGVELRVAQVGDSFLILRDQTEARPGTVADLIIAIDGNQRVYPVILPEGIFSASDFVEYSDLNAAPAPH